VRLKISLAGHEGRGNMKAKVLLIYLTPFKITGLPVGLAALSSVLKEGGHEVKIFNTAFYVDKDTEDQTKIRAERGMSKGVEDEDRYLTENNTEMEEDLIGLIKDYGPDIIGLSIMEIMYELGLRITRLIKKRVKDIPIIVGGVFPTLSPEIVIKESSIDMICVGEGETALVELCDRIANNESFLDIRGLWIKRNGRLYKNKPSNLHNINQLPYPDFTEFDERLFYKPMQGRMYKMVNIATSRGCCFNCAFCSAHQLRELFKENDSGQYNRGMSMEKIIGQIHFQIKKHDPEFIYFSSENFLSMSEAEFNIFIGEYEKINLPFWFQTRIETISKRRISELKRIGMKWLSIGLEHGNEEFRKRVLKRRYSNRMFVERMEFFKELDVGASINNIIGFPFENRDLIFDTIKLNRELLLSNPKLESNVFLFIPFRGSELYQVCEENGLLRDTEVTTSSNMSEESVLNFTMEFQEDLRGLIRTFNLYVKLPKKYYDQIKIAERSDKQGDQILKKLSDMLPP
jgi:radical SAM superfamily enzyme YgiQ (UPF0313 family)